MEFLQPSTAADGSAGGDAALIQLGASGDYPRFQDWLLREHGWAKKAVAGSAPAAAYGMSPALAWLLLKYEGHGAAGGPAFGNPAINWADPGMPPEMRAALLLSKTLQDLLILTRRKGGKHAHRRMTERWHAEADHGSWESVHG